MSTKRILIADDDDAIRVMVERVLRRAGFEVDTARDGYEAIAKLSENEYSTVLLDLMMPRVDGHGVIHFLRDRLERARQPKVIVMTAHLTGVDKTPKQYPILTKPFDIHLLIDKVRKGLATREESFGTAC